MEVAEKGEIIHFESWAPQWLNHDFFFELFGVASAARIDECKVFPFWNLTSWRHAHTLTGAFGVNADF